MVTADWTNTNLPVQQLHISARVLEKKKVDLHEMALIKLTS